ncbi:MAG TPA: hypothetical protein VHL31_18100 [Geminicoccus sp.]|jgi:hypothetical protein|uniref:hypothetical protein n=1 Tax=Geminicoccus sp. TaxID=2024832 RepID=UPI002E32DC5B|nr:hypothetical protein [Geminicoccus sp.]HEX2528201.1 hypothetical protein [Geminicoccus sp.]
MDGFDDREEEAADTVFRDTIMLALAGFVTVVMIVLAHVRPEAQASASQEAASMPGSVMIEAHWDGVLDADVDLWVQGPGDVPVGYSNKGGGLFNLLRDDLGKQMDLSGENYEVSYSRGLMDGEYTVNLHLYRNRSTVQAIPVKVVASVKRGPNKVSKQILVSDTEMDREGQERTVFRFKLDQDGALDQDSVTTLFRPLRSGSKT